MMAVCENMTVYGISHTFSIFSVGISIFSMQPLQGPGAWVLATPQARLNASSATTQACRCMPMGNGDIYII